MLFKQMALAKEEVERPWQEDIDRLQQTLQEVLQAVSRLSGVELPGAGSDSQTPGNSHPQLDCHTLKDRIRSDLEDFATTTASEMARHVERQARVVLAAIHDEASGKVEQVASELRERLKGQFEPQHIEIGITRQTQERVAELVERRSEEFARWTWLMCKGTGTPIPLQIQKLLEPYVEEAIALFTASSRQCFDEQLAQHEQAAQQRAQDILNSLQGRVTSLEQAAREICERNVDAVSRLSVDRLNAAGGEAVQEFEGRIQQQMESAFGEFQIRLEQAAEELQQRLRQQEESLLGNLGHRMEGLESEVAERVVGEITGRVEEISANAIESSSERLQRQAAGTIEHSKEELKVLLELQTEAVRVRIDNLGRSAHDSLLQEAERTRGGLKKLEEEIAGLRHTHIAETRDQIAGMVAAAEESAKEQARQLSGAQLEEVERVLRESREKGASQFAAQLREITDSWYSNLVERIQIDAGNVGARVVAEVKANSNSVLHELSDRVDASAAVLKEEEGKAAARMESLLKNSLEAYQQQLLQISQSQLGEHRQVVRNSLHDLQSRLERSAKVLQDVFAAESDPGRSTLPRPLETNGPQSSTMVD